MAYGESTIKGNLHHHLQGYKGQALSYEIVKELMSFVFDMVKDPSVSWVSKDSHIRLLNGIFKKIGQALDDKSIAGIEESIWSAFVFKRQPQTYGNLGRLLRPGKPSEVPALQGESAAVPPLETKDGAANASGNEALFRRLHLELAAFESRITKMAESSAQESREAAKGMAHERTELEARLAIERAELASVFSKERADYRTYLSKEHAELKEMLLRCLSGQEERSRQAAHSLDARVQSLYSALEALKESMEALLAGHTEKSAAGIQKAEGLLDTRWKAMEQRLHSMEEKASAGRKASRRMTVVAVIGLIVMIAGFGFLIYSR